MNPHYHLHPPPRAISAVDVRAHYTLPGGLFIVVVVHQRRHRPPPPPSLPSQGWLLLGAACPHLHPHHWRPPPPHPTNDGVPTASPHPPPPPAIPPPSPLRSLCPLNHPRRRHGPACGVNVLPPGPTWQVPLPHAPPLS
jgi:hypothetical protein